MSLFGRFEYLSLKGAKWPKGAWPTPPRADGGGRDGRTETHHVTAISRPPATSERERETGVCWSITAQIICEGKLGDDKRFGVRREAYPCCIDISY